MSPYLPYKFFPLRGLLFSSLLILGSPGFSSDSLEVFLQNLPPSQQIDSLILRSKYAIEDIQYQHSEELSKKAYFLSKKEGHFEKSVEALKVWASACHLLNKTEPVFTELNHTLQQAKEKGDKLSEANLLNSISLVYSTKKENGKMGEVIAQAIQIYEEVATEETPFFKKRALAYIRLGFSMVPNYNKKALPYFKRAHAMAQQSSHDRIQQLAQLNLGYVYIDLDSTSKGIPLLEDILSTYPDLSDVKKIPIHEALGKGYLKVQDLTASEFHIKRAMEHAHDSSFTRQNLYRMYAGLKLAEGSFEEAIEYAQMPLWYYEANKDWINLKECYEILYKASAELDQIDQAFFFQMNHTAVTDSLIEWERKEKIETLEASFAAEVKDKTIEVLTENQHTQRLVNIILGVGVLCILVLAVKFHQRWRSESAGKAETDRLHQEEMNSKERVLTRFALENQQKEQQLVQLRNALKTLTSQPDAPQQEIKTLLGQINQISSPSQPVEEFLLHFEGVHPEYFDKLRKKSEKLTPLDLKHCAFIRMSLDSKEVAQILHVDPKSVQMARYRLKKKLNLSKEESLDHFLAAL